MFRFSTKTLFFAFVLVALWFSTFAGYAAGHDVRASVLLVVFLTAGYAAIYSHGKRRAFWLGFFAVMLLTGGNVFQGPVNKYVPTFLWRAQQAMPMTIRYSGTVAPMPAPPVPAGATIATPYTAPAPMVTASFAPAAYPIATLNANDAINDSIETAWRLILGLVVGLIGVWIYSSLPRDEKSQA